MVRKVSDLSVNDCANFIRLDEVSASDRDLLSTYINVAKKFIKSYTGQEDIDAHDDFVIVALILVQDMWDNRTMYIEKGSINRTVQTILDMHSINLI